MLRCIANARTDYVLRSRLDYRGRSTPPLSLTARRAIRRPPRSRTSQTAQRILDGREPDQPLDQASRREVMGASLDASPEGADEVVREAHSCHRSLICSAQD